MTRYTIMLLGAVTLAACGSTPSKDGDLNSRPNNVATNSQNVATNSQNVATNSQNVATNAQNVALNNFTVIDFNAPCDGDEALTAQIMFDDFDQQYETELRYNATMDVTFLFLEFHRDGSDVRCYPAQSPPEGSLAPEVPARVEVGVTVVFETDDGNFAEEFGGKVSGGGFQGTQFDGQVAYSDLVGAFAPEDLDSYGANAAVGFSGFLQQGTSQGSLVIGGNNQARVFAGWPVP